jgi:hypothetical protein
VIGVYFWNLIVFWLGIFVLRNTVGFVVIVSNRHQNFQLVQGYIIKDLSCYCTA